MSARPLPVLRRVGQNAWRVVRLGVSRAALPREGFWLVVRLVPPLEETTPVPLPFARDPHLGLVEALEVLDAAAKDPRVAGVLLRLGGAPESLSQALSLRRAVRAVRAGGKPVVAWGESLTAPELLVGSAADRLWLPESGRVLLVGLRAEPFYLRGLLDRIGVRPEVVRVGRHKTAGEHFTRSDMSPEQREQMEALLDDLYAALVEGLAEGRGLSPERVRELVDRGPYHARSAVEAGLVDGLLYPDEVDAELERIAPTALPRRPSDTEEPRPRLADAPVYLSLRARDRGWRPLLRDLPHLAYVVARGMIHRGGGARGVASDAYRGLFEALRRDEKVRGVLLRIESPGGDGTASDLLWRSVELVRRDKPVVVSIGDVAASGGYYVAAAADRVFAESASLTGSIGVMGGKVDLGELYRRVGVGREAVERGARAGLLSETRGLTADERAALREHMEALYATFLDRVAKGRGLPPEEVERSAGGRVWSGERAQARGLVDELGGPLCALAELRRRAGLAEDERYVLDFLPKGPRIPGARQMLRRFQSGAL